jgi:hypothetical protein
MPAPIDDIIKKRVVQQWLGGQARDKIAADNNIGEGTVSGIVSEFKIGLDNSEFEAARELALQAKKQGLNLSGLASNFRLHKFIRKSGANEDKIETFIANIHSSDIPPEKVIELVNELFNTSKSESIPLDQVPVYIKEKLGEKQKIDEEIKQADSTLRSKNVNIEAINQHIQLNEELKKYGLSTKDIHRLIDVLLAAKEYRYSPGKIVAKLRGIKHLENKENKLKTSCEVLSKKEAKYKEVIPLANLIWDLHIGRNELISFKAAVNEAVQQYGFPASTAAFHVLNNIRDYNKIGSLKKELNNLLTQVFAVKEVCFRQNKSMMAMLNLQSRGITEQQIISLSNILPTHS